MALSEIFGRAKEDELSGFDQNEGDDLQLHVRQCARRYLALDRKLVLVVRMMMVLIALYIASVPGAVSALVAFAAKVAVP